MLFFSHFVFCQDSCEKECITTPFCEKCPNKTLGSQPPIDRSVSIVDGTIYVAASSNNPGDIFSIDMTGNSCTNNWQENNVSSTLTVGAIDMCSNSDGIATASGMYDILFYDSNDGWSDGPRTISNNGGNMINVQDVACFNGQYYAVTNSNIYKYNGATWDDCTPTPTINGIQQIHVESSSSIWIITGNQVYHSTDGGATYSSPVTCGNLLSMHISISFSSYGTIISSPSGMWISNDDLNFCKVSGFTNIIEATYVDLNNIIAVFQSSNGSKTLEHIQINNCDDCDCSVNMGEISCTTSQCTIPTQKINTTQNINIAFLGIGNYDSNTGEVNIIGLTNSYCAYEITYDINGNCTDYDCPSLSLNFGNTCDDGNPNTSEDIVLEDCTCLGVYDCPVFMANIGDSCMDGDDCTESDVYNSNCECVGTPIDSPACNPCELTDQDCDDNCDLTNDSVDEEECECKFEYLASNCDDGCQYTSHSFNSIDCECIDILNEPDCIDGDCSTTDSYDIENCSCLNEPVDPPTCIEECTNGEVEMYDSVNCTCVAMPCSADCPEVNLENGNDAICSGTINSEIDTWIAFVENTNNDAINMSNTESEVIYSPSIAPSESNPPVSGIPSGDHSGNTCANETYTTYAYLLCFGADGIKGGGDDVYLLLGIHDLIVYPPPMAPSIDGIVGTCFYEYLQACDGDMISPATPPNVNPGEDPAPYNVTVTTIEGCVGTFSVDPPLCPDGNVECPNLSGYIPPSAIVEDGTCLNNGNDGSVTIPENACPEGSVTQVQFSNTQQWINISDPLLGDQISYEVYPFPLTIRCICEFDSDIISEESLTIFTNPEPCDNIQLPDCDDKNFCYQNTNQCNSKFDYELCQNLKIPIKFHYYSLYDAINIPNEGQISTLISDLNQIYNSNGIPINFYFDSLCSHENEDQTDYCDIILNTPNEFENGPQNVLNIYVLDQLSNNAFCNNSVGGGHAVFPWQEDAGIRITGPGDYYDIDNNGNSESGFIGRIMAHEIGHYLGLYHTFNQPLPFAQCEGTAEGDGIGDTPFDNDGQNSITKNLMDYNHDFSQLSIYDDIWISPCQRARMIDVLFECRNQFCDKTLENYLSDPSLQNTEICETQTFGYIETVPGCFFWYNTDDEGNRIGEPLETNGNQFTPDLTAGPRTYTYFLQDNGFIYNSECGIKVTITVKSEEECDGGGSGGNFTVSDNNGDDLDFDPGFTIYDPCFCGNDLNVLDNNGQVVLFHNYMLICKAPPGEIVEITNCSEFLDVNGNPIPEGNVGVVDENGKFWIQFWHPVGISSYCEVSIAGGSGELIGDICQQCLTEPIPTMGEWGLLCLALLLSIFGVTAIKNQSEKIMTA